MRKFGSRPLYAGAWVVSAFLLSGGVHAATSHASGYYPDYTPDTARITDRVDNSNLRDMGGLPALAVSANDQGAMPSSQVIRNVTLQLQRSDAKQKQFDAYVHALTTPNSSYYHHWLTAAQIGTMFGPAQSDIAQVKQWLQSQGLTVEGVSATGMSIRFSGTAGAIGNAFHTPMHNYRVNGEAHFANATTQKLPQALLPVVAQAPSLGNFFPKPQHSDVGQVSRNKKTGEWKMVAKAASAPQFTVDTTNGIYDVAPADFDLIYNVNPLWSESTPIRGAGQTVAVLERTDVQSVDVQTFRQAFLPANAAGTVSYVHPAGSGSDPSCTDPGTNADEGEAALDTEWIGAAAPDATIVFASCSDVNSPTFGPFAAAQNLLDGAQPPSVFSLSYGECEAAGLVDGSLVQAETLWEQAAAEGVTVFVSSGDSGSSTCNNAYPPAPTYQGLGVNGLGSSTFNVSVGGTDFNDYGNWTAYWSSSNSALYQSAMSYIPEQTWNDSCASSELIFLEGYSNPVQFCNSSSGQQFLGQGGGGGGASTAFGQFAEQAGIYGSKNYGVRLMPDVSLFASNGFYGHALVYCMSDAAQQGQPCDYSDENYIYANSAGGTSFAAPAMAGIQALINQAAGQSMGNMLPTLYNLGVKEYGTNGAPNTATLSACNSSNGPSINSACVFNNVTVGNNDQPCYEGTSDCYTGTSPQSYGVLSAGGFDTLDPAWSAGGGYNLATGLGSVNATNLVNAAVKFIKQFPPGYVAPYDYLGSADPADADGFSDIAIVNPANGNFTQWAMKGNIVLTNKLQVLSSGYTIGAAGEFFANQASGANPPAGTTIGSLAWTGPDHQLYVWLSTVASGATSATYATQAVGSSFGPNWQLLGAANFDGTHTDELFWWNSSTGQIGWWTLNVTEQTVQGQLQINVGNTISPLISAAQGWVPHLADVNGDGYADIVWTNPSSSQVYIWINNGQGQFTPHLCAISAPAGYTLFGAGDLTGTGRSSLIWTNASTNQVLWWNMNGYGVAAEGSRSIAAGYTIASVADFNGDSLADILWVGTAGDLYEWQSNGSGGFDSFRVVDQSGAPMNVPAGAHIQANRLQGGTVTSGVDTSVGVSH